MLDVSRLDPKRWIPIAERWLRELARGAHLAELIVAEYDRRGAGLAERDATIERLRARTHEIQAQEMAKRAALDAEIAEWRQRYDAAKQWTEDAGLRAEWAVDPSHPFWGMTSYNGRSALLRLVTERNQARAEAARLRDALGGLIRTEHRDWSGKEMHPDDVASYVDDYAAPAACCRWHSRACEPPSELCCCQCSERTHPGHADGSACIAPDLSATPAASCRGHDCGRDDCPSCTAMRAYYERLDETPDREDPRDV